MVEPTPERLPSGIEGLDGVLGGGLPASAINLIVGLPGTGKTLLAQHYAFANGTFERPALYLSTISEPFEKIVRYGQTLEFFDPEAVGRRVIYEDAGEAMLKDGLDAVLDTVSTLVERIDPGLLVIDSFKPFAVLADSRQEYRSFLYQLAMRLSVRPIASLWLGEYTVNEMGGAPEFAIADAVVWLTTGRYDQRELRLLQVLKLRGSGFRTGRHAYRLSERGMHVFPRFADDGDHREYPLSERIVYPDGGALERILEGGYRPGSATLVVGPSGVGKTVLGLQFTSDGARAGESAVFATFDENPSQIRETASGFGWSFGAPDLCLFYRSAVDLHLDEWVYELLELIDRSGSRRAFIDGVANLRAAAYDPVRFQEFMYSLVQRLARQGVTLMMSMETPELFGHTRITDAALSQMADNIVLLQYVRSGSEYRRAVTVLKRRAARTEPTLREYAIGSAGIELGAPASSTVHQRGV